MKLKLIRKIYFFLLLLLLFPYQTYAIENQIEITKNGITKQYSTLSDALLEVDDNEETTIKLLRNIEIDSKITIPSNKNIIIDGDNQYTITYFKKSDNTWYTGQLFDIKADSNVTFRNLTIDGQNNWSFDTEIYFKDIEKREAVSSHTKYIHPEEGKPSLKSNMIINAGNLTFNNVIIKNNYSTKGLIYSTAKTTFIDTTIIHNASISDGGLVIHQIGDKAVTLVEEETLIDDNFTVGNGGIFKIYGGSRFEMNGGTISNNKGVNSNGVVAMTYQTGAFFALNGGLITGNSGVCGQQNCRNGMIYVHSGSTFIMNGGIIAENRGQATGGIDAPGKSNTKLELNGGTIKNNEANESSDHHTDAYLGDYNLTIGENMHILGDVYIIGDIVNNGIIQGDVTLSLGKNIGKTILGTGIIDGDVVLNYSGEIPPTIDENVKITGKIEASNTDKYTTVRFFYNDGIDQNKNNQQKVTIELNSELTLPTISREGHTFIGWYTNKNLTNPWETIAIERDTSLYAKWEINSYVLTWKMGDEIAQDILVYGDRIILPEEPTKDGFVFVGWENYQEGMTMPGSDLTLIAKFKKINTGIENPDTNDNIWRSITILIISTVGLLMMILHLKNKVDKENYI